MGKQNPKEKKNFKPGQFIVGILITVTSLLLLFVAGVMFLMSH